MTMLRKTLRVRSLLSTALFAVPWVLVGLACDDTTTSGGPVDSGSTGYDATTSDATAADGDVPDVPDAPDANVDADVPDAPDGDAADAAPVTRLPFATGLDATGTPLADGQLDPHWTVKDSLGTALTAYVQTDAQGYVGYWLAPSATSKFISPFADTVDPSGSGTFLYTTTFVLGSEVTLANVELVVRYASDNATTAIKLNGQSIGAVTGGSYSAFETVTIATGFVHGTNTIELTTANSGGPTGLRAELDLTR